MSEADIWLALGCFCAFLAMVAFIIEVFGRKD